MKKLTLVIATIAAFSNCAQAATSVSADFGTTGLGAHLTIPLNPSLNARAGINGLGYSYNGNTNQVDYNFKLKLLTFDALLDFYPTESAFRVTAGLVFNNNKIEAHAKPNSAGTYTVNGTTYNAASAGAIDGRIDFRKTAPYLGIGFGNPTKTAGWSIGSDLGIMFQGSPNTSLTSNGCTLNCTRLQNDLAVENGSLASKGRNFRAYPVARLSANYSF